MNGQTIELDLTSLFQGPMKEECLSCPEAEEGEPSVAVEGEVYKETMPNTDAQISVLGKGFPSCCAQGFHSFGKKGWLFSLHPLIILAVFLWKVAVQRYLFTCCGGDEGWDFGGGGSVIFLI